MIHFHIISLFPESIEGYLNSSILGRAQSDKKIAVHYYNPRDYTKDKHKRVDRKPYGGGPGMVLEAPAFLRASMKAIGKKKNVEVVFFSPSGEQFTNKIAKEYADSCINKNRRKINKHIILLCARYEGLDARVAEALNARHISVGPYVLTGGELPAAIVIDAIARHIPGVLGTQESLEEERTASSAVYTRPESFKFKGKEYKVPEVLLSGHHKNIEQWRAERKGGIMQL